MIIMPHRTRFVETLNGHDHDGHKFSPLTVSICDSASQQQVLLDTFRLDTEAYYVQEKTGAQTSTPNVPDQPRCPFSSTICSGSVSVQIHRKTHTMAARRFTEPNASSLPPPRPTPPPFLDKFSHLPPPLLSPTRSASTRRERGER